MGLPRHGLALLPGLLAFGWLGFALRDFVTDDALITLRYARHWADGHGIRWNAGEDPVEGFTNFSHVALGAAAILAGMPALAFVRAFNLLAGFGLVVLTYALAFRSLRDVRFAGAAALLVGAHPALSYWSVSGLETSSYACALLLGVWAVETERRWLACGAFLFASLTRFEGAMATLAVGFAYAGSALLTRDRAALRRHAPWLGAWLLLYAAYFAFRYRYFGYPLSNSAYYKAGGDSGAALILDFGEHCAPLLLLVAFSPYRKLGGLGLALAALLGLYVVGFYDVKSSVAYLHRFFVPVYAPVVLLAVTAVFRLSHATASKAWPRAALALGCALAWELGHADGGLAASLGHADDKGSRMLSRARIAAFIADHHPSSARVMVQDVGVIGYTLLNPLLDSFGLNDEAYTHRFARSRKRHVRALLATEPELIVLVSKDPTVLKPVYHTDRLISADPVFARYRQVHVVESPAEPYHYALYARTELATPTPNTDRIAVDPTASLPQMLESTASAVWKLQGRQ